MPEHQQNPHMCSRNEINNYPIRRLPGAAETRLVLNSVHRKPLMLQRFSHSRVDMFTKTGNRRLRRSLQHQRHDPGNHSGHRLGLRTHTPAYRKIEHHLRTLDVPPTHQQRARRSNHRRSTHPQSLRQLVDPGRTTKGPIEPARKTHPDHARPRRAPTDNAVRFPAEGSWSNRPDHRDNRWTLRILTRNQSDRSATQKKQEESTRQRQLQNRQLRSDDK